MIKTQPENEKPKTAASNKAQQERPLNKKQAEFVRQFLIDLNAAQAYIRAGYSPKFASSQAFKLMQKTHVTAAVQKAMDERAAKTGVTAERVLEEISKLAFSDVRKIFDSEGRLIPVTQLPPDMAASVSSVKVVTSRIPKTDPVEVEYTSEIKFWDKKGSLELLGKHLKLFTDKVEHSGNLKVGLAERIRAARERSGK